MCHKWCMICLQYVYCANACVWRSMICIFCKCRCVIFCLSQDLIVWCIPMKPPASTNHVTTNFQPTISVRWSRNSKCLIPSAKVYRPVYPRDLLIISISLLKYHGKNYHCWSITPISPTLAALTHPVPFLDHLLVLQDLSKLLMPKGLGGKRNVRHLAPHSTAGSRGTSSSWKADRGTQGN